MAAEAAKEYKSSLDELTFNSKLHINVLTMLADENAKHAESIVAVIEDHINKAPADRKLPTLYLMDSIMKNLRSSPYAKLFAQNIVSTFVAVFEKVDEKKRHSMYKLRQTWNDVFPKSRLYGLDVRVHRIDPAWPITAPAPETSSIHVNPRFLNQAPGNAGMSEASSSSQAVVESEDWAEQQSMKREEEERLRKELEEEEERRLKEEEMRRKEAEEQKRRWEEEQEKKMRDELIAKQQELMRLQQQRLELELEETRRALLDKEKELKRKEEEGMRKAKAEAEEKKRKDELAKLKAEEEMRKQMEAEIRRKTEEHLKRKQEAEKKKESQDQSKKAETEPVRRRDPRLKGQANTGKGKASGSPAGKKSLLSSPNVKKGDSEKPARERKSVSPVKATLEPQGVPSTSSKAKESQGNNRKRHSDVDFTPEHFESEVEYGKDSKHFSDTTRHSTSKFERASSHKHESEKPGRQTRRSRNEETKSETRASSSRSSTKSYRDRDSDSRKRTAEGGSSPSRALQSKFKDSDRDRSQRSRNYRSQRLSKSPSSEEELFSVRPKQDSPVRSTRSSRNSRTSRGSPSRASPDYLVKRSRQDDDHADSRSSVKTTEVSDTAKSTDDSGPRKYKKRHSSDVFPEEKNRDTPPLKKIKDENDSECSQGQKTEGMSSDLAELFGTEDVDYRNLNKPAFPKKPLLERPDFNSPQQKGWAKFKENRPEEFPFQQPRRISFEGDFRSPRQSLLSPPIGTPVGGLAFPKFISIEGLAAIVRQADVQVQQGKISQQQHGELLQQLQELQRLQSLMSNIRDKKPRNLDSGSSLDMSTGGDDLKSPPFEPRKQPLLQTPPNALAKSHEQHKLDEFRKGNPVSPSPGHGTLPSDNRDMTEEQRKPHLLDTPANMPAEERSGPSHDFYDKQPESRDTARNMPMLEPPPKPALLESPRKTLLSLPPKTDSVALEKEQPNFHEREASKENIKEFSFEKKHEEMSSKALPKREQGNRSFQRDEPEFYPSKKTFDNARENNSGRNWPDERPDRSRFRENDTGTERRFRNRSAEVNRVPYDEIKYYVPEFDPRWAPRQRRYWKDQDDLNMCELLIDRRTFVLPLGIHKKIPFSKGNIKNVRVDPATGEVSINNEVYTRMGDRERTVMISGRKHTIYVQGLLRKFWIDGHYFELRMDSPPEVVSIAGQKHEMKLDTRSGQVMLDARGLCRIDFKKAQKIQVDGEERTLDFNPPARSILIDGKMCKLNLSKKFPSITIKNQEHGIRFDGPPREMCINGKSYNIPIDRPRIVRLMDKGKANSIAFGGPAHEVIIDDKWYEVKFGGPEVQVQLGPKHLHIQLKGIPPEVKILGEVKTPDEITCINLETAELDAFRRGEDWPRSKNQVKATQQSKEQFSPEHVESPGQKPLEDVSMAPPGPRGPNHLPLPGPRGPPPIRMRIPPPPLPPGAFRPGMPRPGGPLPPPPFLPRMGEPLPNARPRPPIPSLLNLNLPQKLPQIQPAVQPEANSQIPQKDGVDVSDLFAKLVTAGIIRDKTTVTPVSDSPAPVLEAQSNGPPEQVAAKPPTPTQDLIQNTEKKDEPQEADEERSEPVPDLTELSLDKMKVKYPSVVKPLYIGLQCNSCGTRFKDGKSDKYKEHLDWHFRQNKREKEDSRVVRNRRWYYSKSDWVDFEEVGDLEERIVSNYFETMLQSIHQVIGSAEGSAQIANVENAESCPRASANDEENVCVICGDPFEQFYDDEEEEWHLRDAVRVEEKTYHPVCYEDAKNESDSHSLLETPQPLKTESKVPEAEEELPNPISNPLAYLTALSQKAKETSQPIDALAKLTVKAEPIEAVSVKAEPQEQMDTAPSSVSVKEDATDTEQVQGKDGAIKRVASEPTLSEPLTSASLKNAVKEEKKEASEEKGSGDREMSEEDKIVLGFRSAEGKDVNKGAVNKDSSKVATGVKIETKGLTVSRSDPRLAGRAGKESDTDLSATETTENGNGDSSKSTMEKPS